MHTSRYAERSRFSVYQWRVGFVFVPKEWHFATCWGCWVWKRWLVTAYEGCRGPLVKKRRGAREEVHVCQRSYIWSMTFCYDTWEMQPRRFLALNGISRALEKGCLVGRRVLDVDVRQWLRAPVRKLSGCENCCAQTSIRRFYPLSSR